MKFLTDQDVFATTVRFLTGLNHDVATAAQLGRRPRMLRCFGSLKCGAYWLLLAQDSSYFLGRL